MLSPFVKQSMRDDGGSMRAKGMRALVLILVMVGLAAPALADDWRGDGHVAGVVRGPDGKPLAGARVTLRPDDGGNEGPPVQTTDAKGKWGVVGIAGGRWKLQVEADGFITADGAVDVND